MPPGKRWKKGQSGNPNGRPRKIPQLDTLLAETLGKENAAGVPDAQKIITALFKRASKGDVRAAEVLLDRAYGKPKQVTEEIGGQKIKVTVVNGTS